MATRLGFETAIFDVDGTLIDSNEAHANAWAQALREHGVSTDVARIRPLIGMGGDKLLPLAAGVSEDSSQGQAMARRKKAVFNELLPTLQPTPGARQLVAFLRECHVTLVVATSADDREMTALLERAGVADLFDRHASKDDASESKPDSDIERAALRQAHARPESSIMIGDTVYDIEAASGVHVSTIALRCGGHWSDADLRGAVKIFDDPAALLDHLSATGMDQSFGIAVGLDASLASPRDRT
jgi:HAD superfamily hydrolase (TIGR01549 family)